MKHCYKSSVLGTLATLLAVVVLVASDALGGVAPTPAPYCDPDLEGACEDWQFCEFAYVECCDGFENEFKGHLLICDCHEGEWSCVVTDPGCLDWGGSYWDTCGEPIGGDRGCPSDCNGDRNVEIDELIRAVRIALYGHGMVFCPRADASGDGRVAVSDLVLAVKASLMGCPG